MALLDPSRLVLGGTQVSTVLVDDEPLVDNPGDLRMVEIIERPGEHEKSVLTLTAPLEDVLRRLGGLVVYSFGSGANAGRFYGYIAGAEPATSTEAESRQPGSTVALTLLGASMSLQDERPRFWSDATATETARDTAMEAGLGFSGDLEYDTYRWPRLVRAGGTDWEYLVSLVSKNGYLLSTKSGVVNFFDPTRLIDESVPLAHYLVGDSSRPGRQIKEFTPTILDPRNRSVVSPRYGLPTGWTDGVTTVATDSLRRPSRLATDQQVDDERMARQYRLAADRSSGVWEQVATARVDGNPALHVGAVVVVQTGTSLTRDTTFSGLWLVTGVKHHLSDRGFQTNMTLARDGKRRPSNMVFTRTADPRPSPRLNKVETDDGTMRWVSSWAPTSSTRRAVL